MFFSDEIGDAVSEDAGFSASSSGENENWSIRLFDCALLGGIEVIEE